MRVSTAFNKILALPGATVTDVDFAEEGIVVSVRLRRRRLRCPCGFTTRSRYDTKCRRWRHIDAATSKIWIEADIRRLDCPSCGVRTEEVPFARPGARHTRDFEDVVAWLAQRTDKTTTATLMRCSWRAVDNIISRFVAEVIDDSRLDNLYRIGVDEIAYRSGHRYLTVVADHDSGKVVWVAKGKRAEALGSFFAALGPERCAQIEAVSMDLGNIYRRATREWLADDVAICFDPFHVIQMTNRALDAVYKSLGREHASGVGDRQWRATRYALRAGAEKLSEAQVAILEGLRENREGLFRAWELKEELRDLYRLVPAEDARAYLRYWIERARSSGIRAFVNLATQIERCFDGIAAAVELGLSNARLEGVNARIRLIQRRGYGYRSVHSLAAAIYLCLGGVSVQLPTQR